MSGIFAKIKAAAKGTVTKVKGNKPGTYGALKTMSMKNKGPAVNATMAIENALYKFFQIKVAGQMTVASLQTAINNALAKEKKKPLSLAWLEFVRSGDSKAYEQLRNASGGNLLCSGEVDDKEKSKRVPCDKASALAHRACEQYMRMVQEAADKTREQPPVDVLIDALTCAIMSRSSKYLDTSVGTPNYYCKYVPESIQAGPDSAAIRNAAFEKKSFLQRIGIKKGGWEDAWRRRF